MRQWRECERTLNIAHTPPPHMCALNAANLTFFVHMCVLRALHNKERK